MLKINIVILVIEVKAFWIEIVFVDVADPFHVTDVAAETDFGGYGTVFLKMVDHLPVVKIIIV